MSEGGSTSGLLRDNVRNPAELTSFDTEMVDWINAEIDRYGDQLPPIRQFILSVSHTS